MCGTQKNGISSYRKTFFFNGNFLIFGFKMFRIFWRAVTVTHETNCSVLFKAYKLLHLQYTSLADDVAEEITEHAPVYPRRGLPTWRMATGVFRDTVRM